MGGASGMQVSSVHFSPGARTAWHAHPGGQTLHVTEGVGRVQERGGPVEEIRAGETVIAEAGEWHWHGGAPHHFMTHIAVYEGEAEWGDHVTDDEYLGPTG
jgi:quercetin dioxygenase-like cupin family protein